LPAASQDIDATVLIEQLAANRHRIALNLLIGARAKRLTVVIVIPIVKLLLLLFYLLSLEE